MAFVLGVDPGSSGAFAVYDTATQRLVGPVEDTPVWYQTVGKRKRKRIDSLAVSDLFETYKMMGVDTMFIEEVGAYGGQSTIGAFTFGYTVAVVYMAAFYTGFIIEPVTPQTWKRVLNVPGKDKADDTAIVARANEMFPEDRDKFRGPKGGNKLDRAEAAMIAKFGGDYVLPSLDPSSDPEYRIAYRNAKTGA